MHKKQSNLSHYIQFVFILCSAFFVGYMLDYAQTGSFESVNENVFKTDIGSYLITVLILTLIYLGFYGLFNRFFYSTALFYVFFTIYGVANRLKVNYRSEPILPTDLVFLANTKELLSMVTAKLVVVIMIILILIIIVCVVLERIYQGKFIRFNPITRVIFVLLAGLSIGSFYMANREGSLMYKSMTKIGYSNFTPNINQTANTSGPMLTFLSNMHVDVMSKPNGYSQKNMERIVAKYQNIADEINIHRPNNSLSDQTLIFILNESFSDPSRVPNVQLNQDPIPKINTVKNENTSGLMLSSGYGGGTANMEYMTFTGLAYNQFNKSLQTPYTQLVTKQKHPVNIVNSFDTSAAIHPYFGSFYSRNKVYQRFGFQKFRNLETTGDLALRYKGTIGNSDYISDKSSYKDTLWQINQTKGGQFISLVTMQNHMPYNVLYDDNQFAATGSALGKNKQPGTNYAKSLSFTDNSTNDFLNQLNKIDKPITVVWYGDHLPGIYEGNSMSKYNVVQHETDYFIYSNKYALDNGFGTKKLEDTTAITDPNGFIPLALKQMQQQVTPYYALLTKVQEDLPAMAKNSSGSSENLYVDQNNEQITSNQLTKYQRELIHDYKLVQYDLTAGKNYSKANINR